MQIVQTCLIHGVCAVAFLITAIDGSINILPLLTRIVQNRIPVWVFSGDQDSVVPLLGSRTLVRELTRPKVPDNSPIRSLVSQRPGGRLGYRVRKSVEVCHSKGGYSYGTLCSTFKSTAPLQCICSWSEIAQHSASFH